MSEGNEKRKLLLREMSPDDILRIMEERSDALLLLDEKAAEADASLKQWEASTSLAIKDSAVKMGMEEAKTRAQQQKAWEQMYLDAQRSALAAAAMKRKYQSAVIASDLYRTEMASLRNVR